MSRPYLRIGLAGTWRGRRVELVRSVLLALAAAAVAIVLGGVVSAHHLADVVRDRATGRALVPASAGAEPDAERASLFDETRDGEQIYVYWWRTRHPGLIEGIDGTPRPNTWYVSPALLDQIEQDRVLRARYPNAEALDPSGVAAPTELLAHRTVGPDVVLPDALEVGASSDWIGDVAESVDTFPLVVAALAFVVIPSIGLLLAALAPLRRSFDDRVAILRALGAPPRVRLWATLVPVLLTAGPGALAGAVLWWACASRLGSVPLVGTRVFRGDLGLPFTRSLGTAVLATVTATILASVGTLADPAPSGPRPTSIDRAAPSAVRSVPLFAATAVLLASTVVDGRPGARVFLVGLLAAAVGSVVALPWLVARVGSGLATGRRLVSLLVGRRLARDAVASVRSLTALGSVLVLLPVVVAWVDTNRAGDRVRPGDRYTVELQGTAPDASVDDVVQRSGAPVLRLVSVGGEGPAPLRVVGDCAALGAFGRCDAEQRLDVVPGLGLDGLTQLPVVDAAPPGSQVEGTYLLAEDGPGVEARVRALVVNGDDAALQVTAPGRYPFRESRLVAWILGGARLAAVLSVLALGLHLVGTSARVGRSRARLGALGAAEADIRRLAGAEAAAIVLLVGIGCEAVGALAAHLFVLNDGAARPPVATMAVMAGVVVVLSGTAGATAAATAAPVRRRTRSDR